MGEIGLSELRSMCDEYYNPRHCQCGGTRTRFYVDHIDYVRDKAKVALNFYNQKKQKNFNLEKVAKLNVIACAYDCMLFWARNAESDELRLFRGVVYSVGGRTVLLCEIKDDDEIMIPDDHDESYASSESEYWYSDGDCPSPADVDCSSPDNTSVRSKNDLGDGSAVGSSGVNQGSIAGSDAAERSLK